MTTLVSKIWYGTFHDRSDVKRPHLVPTLMWIAFLMLIVSIRLALPFHETESMQVHARAADALLAGKVWGRQILVSSLEFPPLATVALLVVRTAAGWTHMPAAYLLVAICQTWTVCYLVRIPRTLQTRLVAVATLAATMLSPELRALVLTADPNWIAAVPATCALYHLIRWDENSALRDAVLVGVNCGILAVAGPPAFCLGFVLLTVSSLHLRHLVTDHPDGDIRGLHLLLWTPFCYCAMLLLLANWLIMRNVLFLFTRLWDASPGGPGLHGDLATQLALTPWIAVAGLVACSLCFGGRTRVASLATALAVATLAAVQALSATLRLLPPGSVVLLVTFGLAGLIFPAARWTHPGIPRWHRLLIGSVTAALLALTILRRTPQRELPAPDLALAPHPGQITAYVDRHWARGRILVHGTRAPALYLDLHESRFIARADYREDFLLQLASEEQLHLLVPPDNGWHYGPEDSGLAAIHNQGKPWLFLETTWPGGWQLWRVITYPDGQRAHLY